MKRIHTPFVALVLGVLSFASCLGSADEYVYYDDTAITSFTLGTLNIVVDTTSSTGEDSTYTTTRDCSSYKFYIDQQTREIYNVDSLPRGIDASKVVCTVYSKNSGAIGIKSITSDSLLTYSSSDSINFTSPRDFYVYSNSGKASRKYTISVNVHKEDPDTFRWASLGTSAELAKLTRMRAVALDDKVFVFGTDGSCTYIYTSADGSSWNLLSTNFNHALAANTYKSVVTKGGYMYIYDNNAIMRSSDGKAWETTGTANLRQLAAASDMRLYAYDSNGLLAMSSDDGETWQLATTDESSDLLPTEDITYTCAPAITNEDTYHLLIVGNRDCSTYASDTTAYVWGKVEEALSGSQDQAWSYYNISSDNLYKAPRLRDIQTATYDGGIIAVGGESLGGAERSAFDRVYSSGDGGITWRTSETITIPAGFDTSTTSYAFTSDSNNYIWLICGKDGQIWRGRLNRLGWAEQQISFFE